MERREFFKRLGFAGAAIAVSPQILAEVQSELNPAAGDALIIKTPDGTEIPCKSVNLDIAPWGGNGGIYLGDKCIFHIYEWSLDIESPLIDISRDPRYATKDYPVPPYKEYMKGPTSATLRGSGRIVEDYIPFDISSLLRLVLYDSDGVYDAEGIITSLSYGATPGEFIDSAIEFQISGEVTKTYKE